MAIDSTIATFHLLYSLTLSVLEYNFHVKWAFDVSFHPQNETECQTHRLYSIDICWISNLTLETVKLNFHLEISKLDIYMCHDWQMKDMWTAQLEPKHDATNKFGSFILRNHVYWKIPLSRKMFLSHFCASLRSKFLTYSTCMKQFL